MNAEGPIAMSAPVRPPNGLSEHEARRCILVVNAQASKPYEYLGAIWFATHRIVQLLSS
jgi:hypothetical protein